MAWVETFFISYNMFFHKIHKGKCNAEQLVDDFGKELFHLLQYLEVQ